MSSALLRETAASGRGDSDEVSVIIEGKELTGWEAASIEMAVDHIADGFSLDGPWDWTRKELRAAVRPFGYQSVQLFIGNDLYLTGRLDRVGPKLDAKDRSINVQGRSLTGQLADCSHRGDLEFSNLALSTICRKVCAPFGVAVRADNDTDAIPEARAEYGQGAADFLNSLAAPHNMLLNCSYWGELVLTWGAALINRTPGARLREGEYPVESVESDFDSTKRFSRYEVATQFAGYPDIVDVALDSSVSVYRPHLQAAAEAAASPDDAEALAALDAEGGKGETAAQARSKAAKARTASRLRVAALAESCSVTVGVAGWRRPDGKRWAERQTVTLYAPSAMIYHEVPWLIAGVTLKLDVSGGRSTMLRLVLPETYSGSIPKDTPWLD
jgi:prophage tail gpP-like protein